MSISEKITTIAENVQRVYDKGNTVGYNAGYEQQQRVIDGYLADFNEIAAVVNGTGLTYINDDTPTWDYAEKIGDRCDKDFQMGLYAGEENGRAEFYNEFWDSYQQNGNRINYQNAFSGYGWTVDTFVPKYSITPISANEIFKYSKIRADLGQIFKDRGLTLDFKDCTNSDQMFIGSSFITLPVLDFRKIKTSNYLTFHTCTYLTKIEKIMLNNSGGQRFDTSFANCSALADVTFSGVIGQNLDMQACPLIRTSIESIVECLSQTSTGMTLTLKKSAVETAFETSEGAADGTSATDWVELFTKNPNWTISLL